MKTEIAGPISRLRPSEPGSRAVTSPRGAGCVRISPRNWIGALVAAMRTAIEALGGLGAIARPEVFTLSPLAGLGGRPRRPLDGDGRSR